MKRNIVLCAALAAVILLSACGANGETTENTAETSQAQTTASEAADDTEADEEETTAETTAETEPEVEVTTKISSIECLRNGTFAFEVPRSDGKKQFYLYDIAEKKMTKVNESLDLYSISDALGNLIYDNFQVYNAVTGEMLFESDLDKSFFITSLNIDPNYILQHIFSEDTLFVAKTTTAFSGNKSEFGCIGTDGSWIMPMTEGTQLFNGKKCFLGAIDYDYIKVSYANDRGYSYCIYDVKNDKRLCEDTFKEDPRYFYHPEGSDFCYMLNQDQAEFVKYDLKNDCIADRYFSDTAFEGYITFCSNGVYILKDITTQEKFSVLNTETDDVTTFDFSEYENIESYWSCGDRIMVKLMKDREFYTGVFDQNIEPVFEPINGTPNYYCSDDYILLFNSEEYYLYDVKSGEFKTDTYDNDNYSFSGFDETTSTLLVRVKDSEDGKEYYYLADISDPMNYYDPFEK